MHLAIICSIFISSLVLAEDKEYKICDHVVIKSQETLNFSENEKTFICGQKKENDAWEKVPYNQAKYFLETFLQNRGYYNSVFKKNKKIMTVTIGQPTKVSEIIAEGVPDNFNLKRKRRVINEILTPALLDDLEKWIINELQDQGFACPELKTAAHPVSGKVLIQVKLNGQKKINNIKDENTGGVTAEALNRYNAFYIGDNYSHKKISISERRLKNSGVLQTVNYTHTCNVEGVSLTRVGVEGKPRLVRVGVGANTEGLLILKASWRNTRMGDSASLLDFSTYISANEQRLSSSMNLYSPDKGRFFLYPEVSLLREKERQYETVGVKSLFHMGYSWDLGSNYLRFKLGPTTDYISTLSGEGPQESFFLFLESNISLRSHNHEFYTASPRTGYALNFQILSGSKDYYSTVSAHRLNLTGEFLYSYKDYDPPLWVAGLRFGYFDVITDEKVGEGSQIPPNYLHYLGGSQSLRGFSRKSLNYQNEGALAAGFVGLEFRLVDVGVPYKIQPLIFYDIGALGDEPSTLKSPIFQSPGLGFRWESPIGAVRATVGRGYTEKQENYNTQFYISLGEEF